MNRLQEILKRKQEIRSMLEGDQEVDVKEIEEELRQLQAEETKIIEKRKLAEGIQMGEVETREIEKPKEERSAKGEVRNLPWNEAIDTEEYRSAWLMDMMGQSLKEEERSFMNKVNDEYRAFTHNTENTAILIPKTVVAGIWTRAEEVSSLWKEVRKFRVTGELSMIKGNEAESEAEWYVEEDEVDTKQLGFGQLNLTGCELARAIQVTWKLRKMSIPEFEAYIISEIGKKMGKALAHGVYVGRGKPGSGDTFKPEPLGIKTALLAEAQTPQVIEYTVAEGMEYDSLVDLLANLHSSYASGAKIYANYRTITSTFMKIKDATNRPYWVADPARPGSGFILGFQVVADEAIPVGEVLAANLSEGYVANINEDVTMHREDQMKKRLTDYMGYAIVDGAPMDNKAFSILRVTPVA
ncbi:phage major capsid protein [Bacillus infantis]|uniref:phage major capsid protein n=1 Tax=Bacillus infantis TaxID=324767 RepID=UPI003981E77D